MKYGRKNCNGSDWHNWRSDYLFTEGLVWSGLSQLRNNRKTNR